MERHLVLARKYRPQSFEEVIGQEHVTKVLINAISSGKLHHAYLFAGQRGTGKTSVARILAKALNCEKGPTPTPCLRCVPCKEITNGISLDVVEIDAATNRGIEEIRALRENVKFAPASSRYKVYIIDEAHQITTDAFNAFLKTLEEPPEYTVFVLATTQYYKIPETILSRCQKFQFRPIPIEKIVARLKEITRMENAECNLDIRVDEEVYYAIAEKSDGSLRDAEGIFEQLLSYSTRITMEEFNYILGITPEKLLSEFVGILEGKDTGGAIKFIHRLMSEGYDIVKFVSDLILYMKNMLYKKIIFSGGAEKNKLEVSCKELGAISILSHLRVLLRAEEEMKRSSGELPFLVFETYLPYLMTDFVDIGETIKNINSFINSVDKDVFKTKFSGEPPSPSMEESSTNSTIRVMEEERASVEEGFSVHSVPANTNTNAGEDFSNKWRAFVDELTKEKFPLGTYLSVARVDKVEGNRVHIILPSNFYLDGILRDKAVVERCKERVLGSGVVFEYTVDMNKFNNEKSVTDTGIEEEVGKVDIGNSDVVVEVGEGVPEELKKVFKYFPRAKLVNHEKT
jgi:DNA polymerase-3 subunit gamma/tau